MFSLAVQCNVPCGNGTQRRDIICVQKNGNDFSVAPASKCAHLDKPAAVQACEMDECRPQWFTTEWSAVSRPPAAAHKEGNAVSFFTTMHISWGFGSKSGCCLLALAVLALLRKGPANEGGTVSDGGQKAQPRLRRRRQARPGATVQRHPLRPASLRYRPVCVCAHDIMIFSALVWDVSGSQTLSVLCFADENCRDRHHNCVMVVQARLCVYSYYKNACCASCTQSAQRAKRH